MQRTVSLTAALLVLLAMASCTFSDRNTGSTAPSSPTIPNLVSSPATSSTSRESRTHTIGLTGSSAASSGASPIAPISTSTTAGALASSAPGTPTPPNDLVSVAFVDAQTGWASAGRAVETTTDGGTTWHQQYVGQAPIVDLEFVNRSVGWAVTAQALLATTDGGQQWGVLPAPAQPLRHVDFISPRLGWGIVAGGTLWHTSDGGHTWTTPSPAAHVQSVCFSDASHGWAANGPAVQRTADGGHTWQPMFTAPLGTSFGWSATVRCEGMQVAWVLFAGEIGLAGHEPYVLYRTLDSGQHWQAMLEEQYSSPGYPTVHAPQGPGTYPGPLVIVNAATAMFLGWSAAEGGTIEIFRTTNGGRTWKGSVILALRGADPRPFALAFADPTHGWLATVREGRAAIFATTDGGQSWIAQYPPVQP